MANRKRNDRRTGNRGEVRQDRVEVRQDRVEVGQDRVEVGQVDDNAEVSTLEDDEISRPGHACEICWNRHRGLGEVRITSANAVALVCSQCSHTWTMRKPKFEDAVQQWNLK